MPKNVQAKVTVKVPDSATPWTIQSMEFSRPEYWSSEEQYKKGLNDLDDYDGVVIHLQCEVKQALGCITTKKS